MKIIKTFTTTSLGSTFRDILDDNWLIKNDIPIDYWPIEIKVKKVDEYIKETDDMGANRTYIIYHFEITVIFNKIK